MNIAIIGYGRMGREVERLATDRGHHVSAIFDIDKPFTADAELNRAEVAISFTLPDAVLDNLKTAAVLNLPVVEGTTGWYDRLDKVRSIKNLTMIYSANFSIGVYLFKKITDYAASVMAGQTDYDCYLHEWHHTGKADSPSGTAQSLAEVLVKKLSIKEKILTETIHKPIDPSALHVTSTRVGRVPGTHQIGFDSVADSIELKHVAHSREGFVLGAIKAAEWITDKHGIFTMDDFMKNMLLKKSE